MNKKFRPDVTSGRGTCLPPACPAYRQAGGRQGRQVKPFHPPWADSIELMNNEMKENSVDMIFVGLPYNLSKGVFMCQNEKKVSVDKGKWDVNNGLKIDFYLII
ncbi:hypothetical protein KJ785_03860 [Patescibacteria group bacterium]|nr:hypothetical protein [Patescibacteria group bacterium]